MGTIIENYSCIDTEEHEPHPTEGERMYTCTGVSPCGAKLHEPHRVTEKAVLWCRGICKCPKLPHIHTASSHR